MAFGSSMPLDLYADEGAPGVLPTREQLEAAEAARVAHAARLRFGAKPAGGRQEGFATRLPTELLAAPINAIGGFVDAAYEDAAQRFPLQSGRETTLVSTDDDPRRLGAGLGAESALNLIGMPGLTSAVPAAGFGSAMKRPSLSADPANKDSGFILGANTPDKRTSAVVAGGTAAQDRPSVGGIRAYHGSPHDFDRFDMSRIGTGEGAQVYGHGLYFAENPEVARSYRDVLGGRGAVYVDGKRVPNRPTDLFDEYAQTRLKEAARKEGVTDVLARAMQDQMAYIDLLKRDAIRAGHEGGTNHAVKHAEGVLRRLEEWGGRKLKTPQPGRMYEVDIKANPEQLLDWDKSIKDQPIAETVRDLVSPDLRKTYDYNAERGISGANAYYNFYSGGKGGLEAASERLRGAGIPGIKYFDHGSRHLASAKVEPVRPGDAVGKPGEWRVSLSSGSSQYFDTKAEAEKAARELGTRNYVMFDDKLIDIIRKFALPAAVGAGTFGSIVPRGDQ